MILKVRSLDVWGHAPGGPDCDCERNEDDEPKCLDMGGFDVNDSFAAGQIEVPEDATDDEIVETLIFDGFLEDGARGKVIIDGDAGFDRAAVESAEDGEPLYWLDPDD